jgi:DNA modification methylase
VDPQPHYSDDQITLWCGDALEVLKTMPDESVNCVVTSPPYYGLRDYGEPGQYGLEPSPGEYVERMRVVFAEVRRVLAKDGTLWLNLGDSYAGSNAGGPPSAASTLLGNGHVGGGPKQQAGAGRPSNRRDGAVVAAPRRRSGDLPPKNLLGVPWRVAFALQDDGWILRSAIVWDKPNAMPESVTDRPSTTYEMVFLLSRSPRYWFDLDVIREPYSENKPWGSPANGFKVGAATAQLRGSRVDQQQNGLNAPLTNREKHGGRNPGDVWTINTQPFSAAHFAVMPASLAERCIKAGCRPGGVVLDPFTGSGTTGMVALRHGRRFVGIDLSAKYLDLALKTRLAQSALIEEVS